MSLLARRNPDTRYPSAGPDHEPTRFGKERISANEVFLVLDGDDVDASYLTLLTQTWTAEKLARMLRIWGVQGLIRPPGNRAVNWSGIEVLSVCAGPPPKLTLRVNPFMGVTVNGSILQADSHQTCNRGCGTFVSSVPSTV